MKIKSTLLLMSLFSFLIGCSSHKDEGTLHVATSAEYPPFEYMSEGQLKGFDIDLANLIGMKLGKGVVFENMQFSSILPALLTKQVDMAISTITITPERTKQLGFSHPYYHEQMAIIYPSQAPVMNVNDLCGKKVAAQLGTTMAIWISSAVKCAELVQMDNNPVAIEALKVGQVAAVVMDGTQAVVFSQKHQGLAYHAVGQAAAGYAIAFPQDSKLKAQVNIALLQLEKSGELAHLKQKWFGHASLTKQGLNHE